MISGSILGIHYNEIYGNAYWGAGSATGPVDATCNWWGAYSGPTFVMNPPPGAADAVTSTITYNPWIGPLTVNAGGPYVDETTTTFTFDSSASLIGTGCGTVSYLWDFGDGSTSTEANPTHTYGLSGVYTACLTVTIETDCFTYTDTDCVTVKAGKTTVPQNPTAILIYPTGGETLSGTVNVEYFVHDGQDEHWSDLPIYLYYQDEAGNLGLVWKGTQGNTDDHNFLGEYAWATTSLPDGTYRLLLQVQDSDGNVGHDNSGYFQLNNHLVSPTNNPPDQPSRPSGNTNGKVSVEYTYASSTSDPEGDQIWLLFDWGDGTSSGWLGPYNNGVTCEAKHTWTEKSTYSVKVKAKDASGKESSWSESLPITMPYTYTPKILQFLESLLERFPNAFPVLRQLLG
jgi:PKD repeat protein